MNEELKKHKKYCLSDGTEVPGATAICNLLNKPYLVKWANKMGLQGIDTTTYVKDTAKIGTLIHMMLESHNTKTEIDLSDYTDEDILKAEKGFYKYIEWERNHEIIPIFSEGDFISETYKYCGIIDFYCVIDGKVTLVDFKTSKNISNDYFLQTSSYYNLLLEHNYPVDQIMIINIPRDEDEEFKIATLDCDSIKIYFDMFLNLLNVYYIKKRLGWK